ncbi:DUF2948 family protein [Ancylobacter sp. 6x-1]|uniref:DUF2948 family protein n=1 Tax=Ancylobacter crimeensis TaxID=2579147 RepID=A0ABT0DFA5_9HYPH|nr:DUF2948 family protein [Ancylobacter crimeensis]MCK0198640.1 DUF2948 family protein [Ancylobacter crimeensis]
MSSLKLIALDGEDLAILSAHLQDAVVRVGDMVFLQREHRFALLANRFDWEAAVKAEATAGGFPAPVQMAGATPVAVGFAATPGHPARAAAIGAPPCMRRRSGMHFERVISARLRGIDLSRKDAVLNLLAVSFEETDAPSGVVTLLFSGGGEVELTVECLEVGLQDLGPAWDAKGTPCHDAMA